MNTLLTLADLVGCNFSCLFTENQSSSTDSNESNILYKYVSRTERVYYKQWRVSWTLFTCPRRKSVQMSIWRCSMHTLKHCMQDFVHMLELLSASALPRWLCFYSLIFLTKAFWSLNQENFEMMPSISARYLSDVFLTKFEIDSVLFCNWLSIAFFNWSLRVY